MWPIRSMSYGTGGIVVPPVILHVELLPQLILYSSDLSNPAKMQPAAEYFLQALPWL